MRILPCGPDAVLVDLDSLEQALGLDRAIGAAPPPGVSETVPGASTVLVRFDPRATDVRAITRRLGEIHWEAVDLALPGDPVEIPTAYDGPDLTGVARLTGLNEAEVVDAHTRTLWTVAFVGFAPGFPYLAGGDPRLRVPRLDAPRIRVPAGSVALAGEYCGIYPTSSPGGWQLIGRTEATTWDPDADPPALLGPGTRVRFVAVAG